MTVSRTTSERLKVGIVGGGAITQVAHLPVLKKLKTIDVRAICDTDLPKARALADRFGIKDAFDDIEELLRYEALDAVVICSPNHLHESHIQAALSADLHVLVEKPLAMSAASAQRIIRSAEKRDRIVMVGMNHRYRPDVQIVRSFVQSGELGSIESVRGSWHVFRPGRAQLGWRQRRDQAGGGAMLDLGLSILDLGLWLGGNPTPTRVSASVDTVGKERAVEQSGSAFVVCEGDMSLFLDVTWHHVGEGERFGVGVRGSKGTAAINPLTVWKELHGVPADVSPTGSGSRENAFTASYRAEWAHFEAAVAGEAKVPSLQEHLVLHTVVDAIYRSALDRRDVVL
ncbi:MAG: Gfo/Idh/MocA family oxidoreductase [Gemmatimonadales bacterium]|nr:Gfo/Idh/MocA family oxidoreductase [Gemmatimonadales bacterium]MDQ3426302.1 Gfo/Idh/MocA family oxidoreductase [Gemmatimonadota bacterium]